MADVEFQDFSVQINRALDEKAGIFLESAAHELTSQAIRGTTGDSRITAQDKRDLSDSWKNVVDKENGVATVGSTIEKALWNEFGTGSFAVHGDGRKGWWVYIEGQERGAKNSKSYDSRAEAEEAADFLRRVKKLPAVVSNGNPPKHTLQNAVTASKPNLIALAQSIFGTLDGGD